jgi:hypothetical protein
MTGVPIDILEVATFQTNPDDEAVMYAPENMGFDHVFGINREELPRNDFLDPVAERPVIAKSWEHLLRNTPAILILDDEEVCPTHRDKRDYLARETG